MTKKIGAGKYRALVLGGKGDIGTAICGRFARDGVVPVAVGRSDFDLGRESAIDAFFEREGIDFDILVHSAATNNPDLFENLTEEQIRGNLEVNLMGFLHTVRCLIPHWKARGYGRIAVISSLYGFLGRRGRIAYAMSKHALKGAVKTLCIELAENGVLVNAVSPGYIATKLTYKNNSQETIDNFIRGIPLGRLGSPEDIAEIVCFLCSDRNRYITGADIIADGGFSAGGFQK